MLVLDFEPWLLDAHQLTGEGILQSWSKETRGFFGVSQGSPLGPLQCWDM